VPQRANLADTEKSVEDEVDLVDQRGGVPVQNIQDDGVGAIPIGKPRTP
jgi:hypothetical protein